MNEVPPKIVDVSQRKGRSTRKYVTAILLLLFLSPVILFVAAPGWHVYRADAGFKRAKRTIDPKLLLDWEQKMVAKYPFTNQDAIVLGMLQIPRTEIPDQLVKLYPWKPEAVIFKNDGETTPYIRVFWGGGFLQWGFSIGRTNALATNYFGYWTNGVDYYRN
jgi:hypothetical protein